MEIHQRIRELRKHLSLSQEEFANGIGFKKSTVSVIENGGMKASERFIRMLETVYSVNRKWLLKGEGDIFLPESKTTKAIDRVGKIINWTNLSVQEFCRQINYLRSDRVAEWIAKGKDPDKDLLMKIITAYPQINQDWLLEGKGRMLKNEEPPVSQNGEKAYLYKELYELYKEKAENLEKEVKELKEEVQRLNDELLNYKN